MCSNSTSNAKKVIKFGDSGVPIVSRRGLAFAYPSIRSLHRRCAFNIINSCFQTTQDNIITIELDKLIWKLDYTKVILPSGKVKLYEEWCDRNELVQRFADYYCNRKGTRIRNFIWRETRLCSFQNFHIIKVSNIFIYFASDREYNWRVFEYFQGTRFQKMIIFNASECILENLKEFNIEADALEVTVEGYFDELPELEHLPSKPCLLAETEGNIRGIDDRCEALTYLPIGYTFRILYLNEELPIITAWRQLNNYLLADIKYTDGIKGHCHSIDNDKEMFIITKKYSFNPMLQNSYEAFVTLQEAGKSVTYQQMCIADKLIYFKLKWDNIQFDWSTRFGIFLAHLLRVPIARIPSEPINESSRNFRIVNGIFTFLSYCHVYNLPILTIILQILITFFIYFQFLIILPNFLITLGSLLLISVSFAALDVFLFPWKSYPERISEKSTQILCPFG